MTTWNSKDYKDILSATFKRKGGGGTYSRLFSDLDSDQKHFFYESVPLDDAELPVIASLKCPSTWLLITTNRIVFSNSGVRSVVLHSQIRDAVADHQSLLTAKSKNSLSQLKIITTEKEITLEIEPGNALFSIWHVLKYIGNHNRPHSI